LKIILHSGLLDIPEIEMSSIDSFVPKGDGIVGIARLLGEVSPSRNIARIGPSAERSICSHGEL
jgi:hypothetical protein